MWVNVPYMDLINFERNILKSSKAIWFIEDHSSIRSCNAIHITGGGVKLDATQLTNYGNLADLLLKYCIVKIHSL